MLHRILLFSLVSSFASANTYNLVSLHYPPLVDSQKGQASGAAVDVVRAVFKQLGHSFKLTVQPWHYTFDAIRLGHADAVFTIFKNPDREKSFYFSQEVLIEQPVALYTLKSRTPKAKTWRVAISKKRVGVLSTMSYGQTFDQLRKKRHLTAVRAETLADSFAHLRAGKVDYVISNEFSAKEYLSSSKDLKKVWTIARVPSFVAFSISRGRLALAKSFDKGLAALKKSGQYRKILAKYGL